MTPPFRHHMDVNLPGQFNALIAPTLTEPRIFQSLTLLMVWAHLPTEVFDRVLMRSEFRGKKERCSIIYQLLHLQGLTRIYFVKLNNNQG